MSVESSPSNFGGADSISIDELAQNPLDGALLERFLSQFRFLSPAPSVPRPQLALLHCVEEGSRTVCAVAFANTALFRGVLTSLKRSFQGRLRQSTLFRVVEIEAEVTALEALVLQVAKLPRSRQAIVELLKATQLAFESFNALLAFLEIEEPLKSETRIYLEQLFQAMEANRELLGPKGAREVSEELVLSLGLSQPK